MPLKNAQSTKLFHFSVGTAGSTSTARGRGEEETAAHSRAKPKGCRGCRLPAAMVSPGCGKLNCVLHTVSSGRVIGLKMHYKGRVWRSLPFCNVTLFRRLGGCSLWGQDLSQTSEFPAKLNGPIFHHDAVLQLLRCIWP